ncbi:MAG: S-methyl-5'-thioadenosine phosphorylase [Euryarchaeota archaeon]|nr:S-methyl-5'-thioadenosine phosphorylase [Euryarchaeota archaeon]
MAPRIGIIGGTGVYDPRIFDIKERVALSTPYGAPSDVISVGNMDGVEVAFLPRHGTGHVHPPHKINYRANIWAMKHLGVERIISPCAVGSLQESYKPGEIVVVDQFIDFTKRREYTFFDGAKTVHISTADPFCKEMGALFASEGRRLGLPIHDSGTYVCIEGPRFSTRAESRMFRNFADVIGMTLVPECQLAREAEICYTSLAMITDYDVWSEEPVGIDIVLRVMSENIDRVRKLIAATLPKIPKERSCCECPDAAREAGA